MSSALAIGAVTAVIKGLLDNGLSQQLSSIGARQVSVRPPDQIAIDATEASQLNLFLYHITPNQGWRNVGLPSRDSNGEPLSNPPLALDLHYLLTAYGKEDFHAEILLGYGMQVLHETPFLARETIRNKLRSSQPPILRTLSTAELDQQIEQIKISPETLSTEEMSKLWSTFQTHYRPTAAYQVSVVLIESRRPTKSALPVREPKLHVMPFKRPLIEAVLPQILFSGDTLTIQGQNLKAAIVKVYFGVDPPTPLNLNDITDTKIQVSPPTNLRAGVNTVQVLHLLDFGTGSPSEPHQGFESNVVAFILAPRITTSFPITVSRGGTLTLSVISPVEANQRVAILLNDRAIARSTTDPGAPTEPKFLIPDDFPTGEFLLRLQVDGAESRLDVDQNNQYIGPKIAIT